jgi:anti-sigma factor RsiW
MSGSKHPDGHVLQAYHDGELDAPTRTSVAAHCEQCATCQAELDELAGVEAMLAKAPAPELPRTVWHRVKPGRVQESRLRPALALAACAGGMAIGVLLGPIQLKAEKVITDQTWSTSVAVWHSSTTSSLLAVYQPEQD